MKNIFLYLLLAIALAALLSGCSWLRSTPDEPEPTPEELAQAGAEAMEREDYKDAIDYYTQLRENHPFSPYTPMAKVGLGDAYFKRGNYETAISVYNEFEEMHPRHELLPYVLFRTGLSYYEQFTSIDRPQRNMQHALEYFRRVYQVHPETEYAQDARYYMHQCRIKIAEHELYVADFYWRTSRYGSAWERYEYVLENFRDLEEIAEYARERAKTSYYKHQMQRSEYMRVEEREGLWRRFVDWL